MSNSKEMPSLAQVLKAIGEKEYFWGITRPAFTAYSAEDCLRIVETIGRNRNAKFCLDAENRFAYLNFVRWVNGDESMQALNPDTGEIIPGNLKAGIFIGGTIGSGKSWCLEIMQAYCYYMGIQVQFTGERYPKPLIWKCLRASDICNEFSRTGDVSEYDKLDILAIQDLGNEPAEAVYMGNRVEVLRSILESRGDRTGRCLTLISSNFKMTGGSLTERYGERVVSRLREMCNYFEIKGKDRRKL